MKSILLLATIVTLTLPTLFSQPATAQGRSTVLTSGTTLADAKLTVEQLIERAESKNTAKDYQGAIKDYTLAIEMKPDNLAAIYIMRAKVYGYEFSEKAIADYTQAIKLAPNDVETYMARAFFYGVGSPEKAIADYTQAIKVSPKNPEPHARIGHLLARQGKHDEAIKAFTQSIQVIADPSSAYTLYDDRGLSYHANGNYQKAIADFNQSIQLEPMNASGHYYRGLSYKALGQKQEAIADFKRVLEVDKEHPEAEEIMKKIKELQ